jgi:hypothetical protein
MNDDHLEQFGAQAPFHGVVAQSILKTEQFPSSGHTEKLLYYKGENFA